MSSDDASTLRPLVDVPEDFCPECGSPLRADDVYCPDCSRTLVSPERDAARERVARGGQARPLQWIVLAVAFVLVLGLGLVALLVWLVLRSVTGAG